MLLSGQGLKSISYQRRQSILFHLIEDSKTVEPLLRKKLHYFRRMNKIDLGKISRLTFSKRQKKKTIETFKSTSTLFGFKKPFPESPSSASILKKKIKWHGGDSCTWTNQIIETTLEDIKCDTCAIHGKTNNTSNSSIPVNITMKKNQIATFFNTLPETIPVEDLKHVQSWIKNLFS